MTVRKPARETWESFVERQIREAQQQGEFDALAGFGKPLPDLGDPRDPWWWLRKKSRAENLSITPPAFQLRRDVEKTCARVRECQSEQRVRELIGALNERIRAVNMSVLWGPPSTTMELDVDRVVQKWRSSRETDA